MINVKSPFDAIAPKKIRQWLTENNFQPKLSQKYKIYYSLVRPYIPIVLRQWIQRIVGKNIIYKENFINDEVVQLVLKSANIESILRTLYRDNKQSCIVLTHDVESSEGMRFVPRLIELERQYGFKSSWNIIPYEYNIDEGIIRLIRESGHEIGIHGYNHDGKLYYSEKIFREKASYINESLKKYGAVGFRSPMVHRNLLWLQQLNIEYDASCFDYDPFQPIPGGVGSIWPFIAGNFVELPYTMPQDHVLFYILGERSIRVWEKKADWIVKNHGVILMLTHPDYLREKDHLKYYEELLQYLSTFSNSWHCLPRELAVHFRSILNRGIS